MKQWIKFSTGIHKDRKMWKLSKDAQLVFFYLLSIAGSEDKDGVLPSLDDLSLELWFLKFSKKSLNAIINELKNSDIIEILNDSTVILKNFPKWQISEKTKSEINREYYLKSKNRKTEIQTEKNLNSDLNKSEIQTEFSGNSAEIQTLEKEIEIDKEIDKEIENSTLANAKVHADEKPAEKIEKPKLSPDQQEFWKFAKENADFAYQFYLETGIYPVKKEFGRWVNDLRDLAEAEITVDDMKTAVDYMKAKNIPIGAPGSILRTARWLKNNPQSATWNSVDRWDKAEALLESRMKDNSIWGYFTSSDDGIDNEVIDV